MIPERTNDLECTVFLNGSMTMMVTHNAPFYKALCSCLFRHQVAPQVLPFQHTTKKAFLPQTDHC